jgi:uncharacterized protein (DUF2141 family)
MARRWRIVAGEDWLPEHHLHQPSSGANAVIAFHDENDNGLLDANALGVPTEGYGFSNNAQGFLSAPSFAAAAVTLGQTDQNISVSLIYHRPPSSQDQAELNKELLWK